MDQGAAVGGAFHPILLNHLFHDPLGFHDGICISAGLIVALLSLANCLMKPRLLPTSNKEGSTLNDLRVFS